jgi:hypothetical protein
MPDLKGKLRSAAAVVFGGLLYAVLNWIPLVGPLVMGMITGYWVGGGFTNGFRHASVAAALGSTLVAFLLAQYGLTDASGVTTPMIFFIVWVLMVWNIAGIILGGIGGGLGAIGRDLHQLIPEAVRDKFREPMAKSGVEYIICPGCGQGNLSSAAACIGCGRALK